MHHHLNKTAFSLTRDQNNCYGVLYTIQCVNCWQVHAKSAIYKCITLQLYKHKFDCLHIYIYIYVTHKISITYRNIPCNATSIKRNLQVKVKSYRLESEEKEAALKQQLADCSLLRLWHNRNSYLTPIITFLIKYWTEQSWDAEVSSRACESLRFAYSEK